MNLTDYLESLKTNKAKFICEETNRKLSLLWNAFSPDHLPPQLSIEQVALVIETYDENTKQDRPSLDLRHE